MSTNGDENGKSGAAEGKAGLGGTTAVPSSPPAVAPSATSSDAASPSGGPTTASPPGGAAPAARPAAAIDVSRQDGPKVEGPKVNGAKMNGVKVEGAKQEDALFLSDIIGTKVYVGDSKVGHLDDFLIQDGEKVAEVTHLIVTRPFGNPSLLVPWDRVRTMTRREVVLDIGPVEGFVGEPLQGSLLLRDYVLDKKVLDIDGKEVEVVYDVKLVRTSNKLLVTAVDLSGYGRLKRMGLRWFADRTHPAEERAENHEIPWVYIQPLPSQISSFKGDVRLKVLKEKLSELHPVDIADIIEELEHDQRLVLFSQLEPAMASDTLEEIEPKTQRDLISSLDKGLVAKLIDQMTPGQAADVLSVLPSDDVKKIMELLDTRIAERIPKIRAILEKHEEKVGNYTTMKFIKVPPEMTVEQAKIEYPWLAKNKAVIMYLYVAGHQDRLLGVIDIKEILRAENNALLGNIMVENLVSLRTDSTLKEASDKFMHYDFRALPVLDEDGQIVGVITYRDVMNLTHHFIE